MVWAHLLLNLLALSYAAAAVDSTSPSADSHGFGPRDFPAAAVITGEDWHGVTSSEIHSWDFFSLPNRGDPRPFFRVTPDPLWGQVVQVDQTPTNRTVFGGRIFSDTRAKGAPYVARQWIYSAVWKFSPNWGVAGHWKAMFGNWAEPNSGNMRVEMCFPQPGVRTTLCHSGTPANWRNERTLRIDPVRIYSIADGDYYQTVMFVKLLSTSDVRIGWAFRKLTSGAGRTLQTGRWVGIMDTHDPGTWTDDDGIRSIHLGNTLNDVPRAAQSVYYGPWVVLDLSNPEAPRDPWGIFSFFGI